MTEKMTPFLTYRRLIPLTKRLQPALELLIWGRQTLER